MKKPAFLTALVGAAVCLFGRRNAKTASVIDTPRGPVPCAVTRSSDYYNRPAAAHGIPTPPPRNQRQRRKDFRQLMANGR